MDPRGDLILERLLMSKLQLIDAIRRQNRSAAVAFLTSFDEQSLETYLKRLNKLLGRRGRLTHWVREGMSPAMVTRLH
jgi:hypothetical protein